VCVTSIARDNSDANAVARNVRSASGPRECLSPGEGPCSLTFGYKDSRKSLRAFRMQREVARREPVCCGDSLRPAEWFATTSKGYVDYMDDLGVSLASLWQCRSGSPRVNGSYT
jgi:hypothetical protein